MGTKYEVEVLVEIELDLDDVDGEDEAFRETDQIMQRCWDNDNRLAGLRSGPAWHFTILEGAASRVDDHLYSDGVVDSSSNDTTTEGP